jgi:hypothetical protein
VIVTTQWGVESPWGSNPVEDLATAEAIVKNMTEAGHAARVVWRGVTPWIPQDGMD